MPRKPEELNPEDEQVRAFDKTNGVACIAPQVIFSENWADIPAEDREIISRQKGLPCDGGGVPGEWCQKWRARTSGCHYSRKIKRVRTQQPFPGGPKWTLISLDTNKPTFFADEPNLPTIEAAEEE